SVEKLDKQGVNTIPLKKVIINIRTIIKYLENIYSYNSTNVGPNIPKEEIDSASQFITRDQIDWKKFKSNLSLQSSAFRHAIRVGVVLSGTYLTLNLINFNPNGLYWTLLTILVILKPGFGSTQERNAQRLIATLICCILRTLFSFTIDLINLNFIYHLFSSLRRRYLIALSYTVHFSLATHASPITHWTQSTDP